MAIFNSYVSLPEGMYPTVHLHTMAYIICIYAGILWTSVCDNSTVQNYIYIHGWWFQTFFIFHNNMG